MGTDEDVRLKVISSLSSYHKEPAHPDILSSKILHRISMERAETGRSKEIIALLFGWTSVSWVRRSMTLVSLLLIALFVYQQYEIKTGLADLNMRLSENVAAIKVRPAPSGVEYTNLMIMGGRFSSNDSIRVAVNDIQKLIKSYDELELSYRRIYNLLQKNPDLLRRVQEEFGEALDITEFKPKI